MRSLSSRSRSVRTWDFPRRVKPIQMGALLHDVGKIGIPEAILNKPGPLTDDEFDVMKRHTVIGADIIASIPGMDEVVALVRSSHERWDGRGYPDGLAGLQYLAARM